MRIDKAYKTELLTNLKTKNEFINSLKAEGLDKDPRFQDWFYENELTRLNIFKYEIKTKHPFHLVRPSPWPFWFCVGVSYTVYYLPQWWWLDPSQRMDPINDHYLGGVYFGLLFCVFILTRWWRDVLIEACLEWKHTLKVQEGLKIGFILFLVSEAMFFVSLFWAYFHSSLSPTPAIGCMWPPKGIEPINPAGLPAVNTAILLLSGVTITKAHKLISTCRIFPRNLGLAEYSHKCLKANYLKPNYLNQLRVLRILLRVQSLQAKADFEEVVKPKAEQQGFNLGEYFFIVTEESVERLRNMLNTLLWWPAHIEKDPIVWLPFNYDQITIYYDMISSEDGEADAWFKQIQTYTAWTIYLGWLFLLLQLVEYIYAPFAINDSIYGSLFYVMTGCHGFHVFVGVIYLSVSLWRIGHPLWSYKMLNHKMFCVYLPFDWDSYLCIEEVLTRWHDKVKGSNFKYFRFCVGFETSAWYWHFVDIVWIILYFVVYIWGS